jgi:alkylation response protein AidB-like acyl-CoA dehydrogenase
MTSTEEFDAQLAPAVRQFIDRVRDFARAEIAPRSKDWEYARQAPRKALAAACREGFAGVELRSESGGLGLEFSAKMRMAEEFSRHDAAFAFALMQQHNVLVRIAEGADERVAARLVPRMLEGDMIGCTAMSEASGGSDFAAIRTIASKVEGGWRLTGEKGWIANAAIADVCLVYAQTDPALGRNGIACFIVEASTAGMTRLPGYELHGAHAIGVSGFTFDDCFVDDAMLLYPPGKAFATAMLSVNRARVHVAAMNAGMLDAALGEALIYCTQRHAFGEPLLEFQGLRWSLVDVATELDALRLLTYRGARLIDRQADAQEAAAMAKKFAGERALAGIAVCMQAMGANGLRADYPLARHLAMAKLLCYTDGSTEMMNERIGYLLRKRVAP